MCLLWLLTGRHRRGSRQAGFSSARFAKKNHRFRPCDVSPSTSLGREEGTCEAISKSNSSNAFGFGKCAPFRRAASERWQAGYGYTLVALVQAEKLSQLLHSIHCVLNWLKD